MKRFVFLTALLCLVPSFAMEVETNKSKNSIDEYINEIECLEKIVYEDRCFTQDQEKNFEQIKIKFIFLLDFHTKNMKNDHNFIKAAGLDPIWVKKEELIRNLDDRITKVENHIKITKKIKKREKFYELLEAKT